MPQSFLLTAFIRMILTLLTSFFHGPHKRLDRQFIGCEVASYGCGIRILEGSNRKVIFFLRRSSSNVPSSFNLVLTIALVKHAIPFTW